MQADAKKLLDLTLALADAVERGDTQECAQFLKKRGQFLADLSARHPDRDHSPELRQAFETVRGMDVELERRLSERRDDLGNELVRLGAQKNREADSAPRLVDLQA